MDTYAVTQENMSIYSINSTTIQKEMSREFQRCKRSKERGRERGNAGRMACSPTLTIPKPFGPAHLFVYCYRCNCVGWGPKQATVGRMVGEGGDEKGISSILFMWPRKLCNHSTAQTLSFSSLQQAGFLKKLRPSCLYSLKWLTGTKRVK